jgi:hypothetical protein
MILEGELISKTKPKLFATEPRQFHRIMPVSSPVHLSFFVLNTPKWQFGALGLKEAGGNRLIKYADMILNGASPNDG